MNVYRITRKIESGVAKMETEKKDPTATGMGARARERGAHARTYGAIDSIFGEIKGRLDWIGIRD